MHVGQLPPAAQQAKHIASELCCAQPGSAYLWGRGVGAALVKALQFQPFTPGDEAGGVARPWVAGRQRVLRFPHVDAPGAAVGILDVPGYVADSGFAAFHRQLGLTQRDAGLAGHLRGQPPS